MTQNQQMCYVVDMSDLLNYDNLLDRNEIAHILGVGPTAVSNYVSRTNEKHPEFPTPVISKSGGRFRLWDLDDVRNWHMSTFPNRSHLWDNVEDLIGKYRNESVDANS